MRALRWIAPALVAAACAVAATPVLAADDDGEPTGIEVVEAGSALWPPMRDAIEHVIQFFVLNA
jgi:hypothetical protein